MGDSTPELCLPKNSRIRPHVLRDCCEITEGEGGKENRRDEDFAADVEHAPQSLLPSVNPVKKNQTGTQDQWSCL